MPIKSLVYLIIFLPLISSFLCQIFGRKQLPFIIAVSCFTAIIAIIFSHLNSVFLGEKISNDFDLKPLSLGLEFSINQSSTLFLISIILLKLLTLIYYKDDIKNFLTQKNSKVFYSVYLLQSFAIIGLITTNNLFNLFLFLEIYSCSFFAIFSISREKKITQSSFRYFCLNSAASLLILFSFMMIYLIFNNFNLEEIKQILIFDKDVRFFTILASLVAIGLAIKFFPIWLYFENLKNNNLLTNFFAIDSLFVKANIGIFFALKFSYLFFANQDVATFIICGSAFLIFYSLFRLHQANHLKLSAIYLCIINLCLILICLAIKKPSSSQAIFFYWLNFNLINFAIFIFSTFLKRQFGSSSFNKISALAPYNQATLLPLRFLIIFVISSPFTFLFCGNFYLINETLNLANDLEKSLIIAVFVILNFSLIAFFLRIANLIFMPEMPLNKDLATPKIEQNFWHILLFWLIVILTYSSIFCLSFFNHLSIQFTI